MATKSLSLKTADALASLGHQPKKYSKVISLHMLDYTLSEMQRDLNKIIILDNHIIYPQQMLKTVCFFVILKGKKRSPL